MRNIEDDKDSEKKKPYFAREVTESFTKEVEFEITLTINIILIY